MYFRILIVLFISVFSFACSLFQRSVKIAPVNFDYKGISKNYFSPSQSKPFPLTVQRGNNLYNSTTADGKYLFYATDQNGNFDIWFRDLESSVVVPVTNHPFSESKPAISPDGRYLVFVSEEYDPDGDIILLEMNLEEWIEELLQGNRFPSEDFVNLTNPNARKDTNGQRVVDTDPIWSPDGKLILYVTDRFSPGLPNLALIDPKKPEKPVQLTKEGGVNPSWSKDGSTVYYLSYSDIASGEIYSLNIVTSEKKRITVDDFLDYSPTVDFKGNFLYYSSIRKDTNGNGTLDERDNNFLIMKSLKDGTERVLSSGESSYFDVKYSSFNGGSILFSAPFYNSINVYFLPENGAVPKQNSISEQYQYAKGFAEKQSPDSYFLALDSVELFFSDDPLYPVYQAKVKWIKSQALQGVGKTNLAKQILQSMADVVPNGNTAYEKGLGRWELGNPKTRNSELENYISKISGQSNSPDAVPGLLHLLADDYEKAKDFKKTFEILNRIYSNYPAYHQIHEIKRRLGGYSFYADSQTLPDVYKEIFETWEKEKIRFETNPKEKFSQDIIRDLRYVFEDIQTKVEEGRNYVELGAWADKLLSVPENQNIRLFKTYLQYVKSKTLASDRKYAESNAILDSIIPIPANIDLEPQGQPSVFEMIPFQSVYKNPVLLRANLQKYYNEKATGNTSNALRNMKIYLEFYDPILGVDLGVEEIQNAFFYFENKALEFERLGNLLQSSFHYFFNNQNMFLVKTRNLYLDSLYKEYAVYYQRKMVDTIFDYGKKLREEEESALLNQINILGKDKLNVIGNISDITSVVTDNKYLRSVVNIKDFEKIEVLSSEALRWTELYYKQSVPRARPYLDLATLYGYAYFLINKYVIFESYYYATGTMTDARKKEILENYKKAEWELKWIIFADPTYYDAYQLLGWLYQYVDLIKLRKEDPAGETDEEKYLSLYKKYFPEKNLEANVELYTQILVFLGDSYPDSKVVSDLNLNLGNNYFLLNNYPKANESYTTVEGASKFLLSKNQFEEYRQEAVFRYNFGRSLIYQGQYKKAIEQFEKSIDIYFKKEYYQAVNSATSEDNQFNRDRLKNVRSKLALLFSLKGLSELESQRYTDASVSFQTAIAYNNEINFVNPVNLYNYLAIAFQKSSRFRDSYAMLDLAEKEYQKEKEGFWKRVKNWSPWNLILPDSVRVIGEGRFPGDFPTDFKYLLTLGIRIENHIEQKEFSIALKELENRNKFIQDRSLHKTVMGSNILAKSKQVEAQIHYENKDHVLSVASYQYLADLVLKNGTKASKEKAFIGYTYSVFSFVEANTENHNVSREALKNLISYLGKWKESSASDCEISELCDEKFRSENIEYDIMLGGAYFYLGELDSLDSKTQSAQENYAIAAGLLENPGFVDPKKIGLNTDPLSRKERVRNLHNLATIYFKLGDISLSERKWKEAYELAYEFRLDDEIFWLNVLKSEIYTSDSISNRKQEVASVLKTSISELNSSWKKRPELRLFAKRSRLDRFVKILTKYYLQTKEYASLLSIWEERRNVDLFRETIGAQFEFEDSKLNLAYADLVSWVKNYKKLVVSLEEKAQNRENLDSLLSSQNSEVQKFQSLLEKVNSVSPEKISFFDPYHKNYAKEGSDWIAILHFSNQNYLFRFANGKLEAEICPSPLSGDTCKWNPALGDKLLVQVLGNEFSKSDTVRVSKWVKANSPKTTVSFIYDRNHIPLFSERNERNWKWVTLLTEKTDKKHPSQVRQNIQNELGPLLYDTDILVSDKERSFNGSLFSDSYSEILPLREIFSASGSEISMAAVPLENIKNGDWQRFGYLFEVLRSKRIQNVVGYSGSASENELLSGNPSLSVLGNSENIIILGNWDKRVSNKELLSSKAKELIQKGFAEEKEKDFNEAYNYYYTASTLLGDNDPKLPELELRLAKLKVELFPQVEKRKFFEPLWKRYDNSDFRNRIRYEYLVSCLSAKTTEDCGDSSSDWKGPNSDVFAKAIGFYSKLRKGSSSGLAEFNQARMEVEKSEDPFLQAFRIGNLYLQNYLIYEAEGELQKLYASAKTAKEKNVVKNRELEILFHRGFLFGDQKIYLTNLTSTSAYSYGFRKDWKGYDEKINSREFTKFGYADSIYDQYRRKLYQSWKDLQIKGYFDPFVLTPEFLTTGDSVLSKLSHLNRTLMFSLMGSSVGLQKKNEVNSLVDLILQEEKQEGRIMRMITFQLFYAKKLYLRGDSESGDRYLKEFESAYEKIGFGNKFLDEEYLDLKWKVGHIYGKSIPQNVLKTNEFIPYYTKITQSNPSSYIGFLNEIGKQFKNEYYSINLREEWEFLILHMLKQSLAKNSSEVFFDVAMARDQLLAYDDRYLGKKTFGKMIPKFSELSERLKKKIPENQDLSALIDVGIKTYLLGFAGNKSSGREFFADNREINKDIMRYFLESEAGGLETLLRDAVSDKYKNSFRLSKGKRHYIYLIGIHSKVPIQLPDLEYYYLGNIPKFLDSPSVKKSVYTANSFNLGYIDDSPSVTPEDKILGDLTVWETGAKKGIDSSLLDFTGIDWSPDHFISLGGVPIASDDVTKRKGQIFYSNNRMGTISFYSNDYSVMSYHLSNRTDGLFMLHSGTQQGLHNIKFAKKYFEKSELPKAAQIRLEEAKEEARVMAPEDRYWTGFKLFTSQLIED
ncbi:biopolymer transporter TolR [Leptospira kobayashii]|uniref:Biopolymer transporter TolR n=1 Tax=Leptospira kobayashii TaxID=1917830 RepID=A0ABN6KLJ3_9LEPT|nr:biopolymer transporter TolR [Leptospira kobayashii]BDA79710.1 biopolymer transporter TolR [Leptospira kobayashii]